MSEGTEMKHAEVKTNGKNPQFHLETERHSLLTHLAAH